jgi:hypothetical protein
MSTISRSHLIGAVGMATALVYASAGVAAAETPADRPATFTSAFTVMATADQIFNTDRVQIPGEVGATGTFNFMVNSDEEIICYDITLRGVTPPYMSMAKTATHIHQAAVGVQGPPRISFPNPTGEGDVLTSAGCLKGPFTTGLEGSNGADTGEGFTLAQLEENPAGFYADTHTDRFVAGAVRGQLTAMPVGGVETGLGGQAVQEKSAVLMAGVVGALLAAVAGAAVVARRHRAR